MFVYFNLRLVPIQIERALIYVYMLWPKTTRALITTIGGHWQVWRQYAPLTRLVFACMCACVCHRSIASKNLDKLAAACIAFHALCLHSKHINCMRHIQIGWHFMHAIATHFHSESNAAKWTPIPLHCSRFAPDAWKSRDQQIRMFSTYNFVPVAARPDILSKWPESKSHRFECR